MSDPKPFHCRHIFTDGHQCGSPALRGEKLCFYHHGSRRPAKHQTVHGFTLVVLPAPEDLHAIQRGVGEILRLTGSGCIDNQCASVLLRGLALASTNLARIERRNAAREKAAARSQTASLEIVQDYVEDPELGTIALGPDPDPRPQGPIPDPVTLFVLEPRLTSVRSKQEEAQIAVLYDKLAQELAARTAAPTSIPIPKSLQVQTYPSRNEDFGPFHKIPLPSVRVCGEVLIPAQL